MSSAWLLVVCLLLLATALPAAGQVTAWFAPSASKVLRDAKPVPAPRWELAAARNEVEACQLVLRAARRTTGVQVAVGPLRHSRGKGELAASLYRVAYVPITKERIPYPDPLPPLGPLDLRPGQAQPVWISVRVPKQAAPGLYRGTVTVQAGKSSQELPLAVRVWDFALPDTPSCATAFGLWTDGIARQHGVAAGSPELQALYARYYEMLLDHGVSAYTIPVDLRSPEAARYLSDPRLTSYLIPYPADDGELKATIAHLVAGDWFAKGYFYPLDEPVTKEAYDRLLQIGERLRRIEPRYRLVSPFFRNPDFGEGLSVYDLMAGVVNVWCPNEHFFDLEARTRPYLADRRRAGDTVWWYVCCGPGNPYNNFFVEMSAMAHRTLFWQQKREGVQGLLYWSTTYWNPSAGTADPWQDMATVKDINPNIHGDGSLLYPGKQVGVDGPVSSLRLEMIRDGIEDFEYLTLAEQRLGPEAASKYVARVCRSLTDYEQDPARLETVRRELGTELERATAELRSRL